MYVRRAEPKDAAEIANVHINSWREAYKGLLPAQFLDDRPLHFKNRYELWQQVTADSSQMTYVAEDDQVGVVGFINGNKGRDAQYKDHIEVYCIYLLAKFHGQGVGYKLLRTFFDEAANRGFAQAYLWVLEGNPTISFYERAGAEPTGETMADTIGGKDVTELCYRWDNIS